MTGSAELAPDLDRRFGGLARLYGADGAQAIRGAHGVVIGIGGVGSWSAEALARSGVARLTLIDLDHVAESNINRQVHALDGSLGQAKVLAMRERIARIHPACRVEGIEDFVTPENWLALLPADADAVIDACDQVRTKTALAAWARSGGPLFISVGAAGGKRLAQQVEVADLADVTHDPLLARVRQQLRRQHAAPREGRLGVACVFSREAVASPAADCALDDARDAGPAHERNLNCHGYGSSVSVTASFGFCAAGWVLDKLARRVRPPVARL